MVRPFLKLLNLVKKCWVWRTSRSRMIMLKPALSEFLRCEIRDVKSASFWYVVWCDLGPLISYFGEGGPRQLRIRKKSSVASATRNGCWAMPHARSNEAQSLLTVLTTVQPPHEDRGTDLYLWCNASGSFVESFSSKETWEQIRLQSPTLPHGRMSFGLKRRFLDFL